MLLGHRRVEVLAFAQLHHRLHIAPANQLRVQYFQAWWQGDALRAGDGVDIFGLGQQHAAGDATGLADGRCLHQQRLCTFWQNDALVCLLRALDQLVAEHRRRQAQLARGAATLVQPGCVEVAGDKVGNELGAFAVVHRDFPVERIELVGGVVRTGTDRQDRQARLQRAAAQPEDASVRFAVTGQQQAGQRYAIDRSQADGQDDIVAVARCDDQGAGGEQWHGIGHGARTDDDLAHAPLFVIAGIEHLGAKQLGHVAGARCVQLGLIGDAAQQAKVIAAQQRRVFAQAGGEVGHAFVGADLVEDHPQYFRVAWAAEQLRLQFDPPGQLAEHFVFRRRDQDHLGIQALGQVQVDPRGIAGVARGHHAFDHDHVIADAGLLVKPDDFFQQFVQLAIAEHAHDLGQAHGHGGLDAVGTGDQFAGAFGAGVARVGLGDGLEETHLQPGPFQGTHQAQADRRQADTKVGRRNEKCLHACFSK